ncbi:MAG: TROVE domain-containing protein, partial [Muribaculaceae bacterium]
AYMDGAKVADEISRLIPLCAPDDVSDLAIEVRLKQKLRHTPLFIAVEMCKHDGHRGLVGTLLPKIITRPDMLTDFMALYWADGKCTVCNQARKGLAEAFHNFDEYQFAKYDRDAPIKLRDVMFLAHPKARTDDEQILFRKIADRELSTPDTWEVALSSGEDKKEAWTRLVSSRKLGALATLRNISNMKRASVDKEVISDAILNAKSSMLLPLDFYKAARQNSEFARDIEEAMQNAYLNLPKLPGRTLFIVDISGSMRCNISGRSDFSRLEVACMMAMLASYQCEQFELVATSGDDSKRLCSSKHIKYPSRGFDIIDDIENAGTGNGGIFTRQCLEWCKVKFAGIHFDRIIVFSDSQDCDYPDKRTPKPFGVRNYICDVSAHTRGINYKGVWTAEISGWSEHFLTFIASLEGMENTFEN